MLDIKKIRTQLDEVKEGLKNRNSKIDLEPFLELDAKRRELLAEVEQLKNKQNVVSKQIP